MHSVAGVAETRSYDVRYFYYTFFGNSLSSFVLVAFKVYDMDRDGYISNGELFLVLKMMVGNNLKVRSLRISSVPT